MPEKYSERERWISRLLAPIGNDLLSGAAELALQAISVFHSILSAYESSDPEELKKDLKFTADLLIESQPAMASLANLSSAVITTATQYNSVDEIKRKCILILDQIENTLCDSVGKIAEFAFDLIPPGEMVFAYSFSSTVISCLLHARAKGRYFRVACTESRPSLEGRKLASRLAAGNIETICTFDSAMGMILPTCSVAFMGCDSIGIPGIVNKTGSLLLALACHEMKIPLYAMCDTTKFIDEEHFFEFENHQRPGSEIWDGSPPGVTIINRQFELIPFEYISGLITEKGLFTGLHLTKYLSQLSENRDLQVKTIA